MLQVKRFINELMKSNCYVLYDDSKRCIVVDPASERCEEVIAFFEAMNLVPEYVVLTHEHTDHTWGCNTLIDRYDVEVICTKACKDALPKEGSVYFQLYYDDPNYTYSVKQVDVVVDDIKGLWDWGDYKISFVITPGHSVGSMCMLIENMLFSGDTIMPYKPYIPKKMGSKELYQNSIQLVKQQVDSRCIVYPGHGEPMRLSEFVYE